jgi:Domain of unknown function (DUF5664)
VKHHLFTPKPDDAAHCHECGNSVEYWSHRLPDTGARESFGQGMAVREADPNKPAVEGISPFAVVRLGMLMTRAKDKYGDYRNWEKGIPITRYIGAIIRHAFAYLARDTSEDHMAAVMWNAMCIMHHEAVGSTSGAKFSELDNRPTWNKENGA